MSIKQLLAVDCLCPIPVIKAQQIAKTMQAGEELEIICTDKTTLIDIPTWADIQGHQVLAVNTDNQRYHFLLKIKGKINSD